MFDIHSVVKRLRVAVKPFPKAMLFELYLRGYTEPFEQLVACILSIRTLDEVSLKEALNLLGVARTPEAMKRLSVDKIDALINKTTFHYQKAQRLVEIAKILSEKNEKDFLCNFENLISLPGVGPKCANLVLGIACSRQEIGVDIHVHRVTNRWGYVHAKTPEETRKQLEAVLPKKYWVEINALLVPFGKHICLGRLPKCSTCPILNSCQQVGVGEFQ